MIPIDNLCKINVIDSESLDDIKYYMTPTLIPDHSRKEIREYKYFGLEEQKFAQNFEQFSYRINQYGFREDRTDNEIDIGAFGCSFTFGQGLPTHSLWHQIVARETNQTIYNFGVPGASIQSILDIFCIVSKHIKMKKALILLPSYNRFQLAKVNSRNMISLLTCIPMHAGIFNKESGIDESEFYKIIPDEEFVKTLKNSVYMAEQIAKLRDISISLSSWDKDTYEFMSRMKLNHARLMPRWTTPDDIANDKARDGLHPGVEHHMLHAFKFQAFAYN